MKKVLLTLVIALFATGLIVQASDLIIESKTQSYSEQDNKLKFEGDVKVSVDDMHVVGDSADVSMDENQKLDTATFYNKPYAYEVKKNKKREVKANILKMSLITKVVNCNQNSKKKNKYFLFLDLKIQKSGCFSGTGTIEFLGRGAGEEVVFYFLTDCRKIKFWM